MSNAARWNRLLKASEAEYKQDSFAKCLENLERANLACTQATADFLQSSRELRKAIDAVTK